MDALKIAVAGATGRMGRMLVEAVLKDGAAELAAAIDLPNHPLIGTSVGELVGLPCALRLGSDAEAGIARADCLIDFTRPRGTLDHLAICRRRKVAMVIGTTGLDDAGKEAVAGAARDIPVVFAPNMSVGVNVMFKLLDVASRLLAQGYDVEIVEAHHRLKVDAPSGTALRMGEVIAEALGRDFKQCAVFGREGVTGEREASTIGFSSIRGGDMVGEHTAMFCGTGERIEISHKTGSRAPYALGALRAARFLAGKANGLFDMQDVLGLR
jgi:4-hydroxy-tetrahydrodipicolinate reductase